MENKQGIDGYFEPFAVSLIELMAHHPKDGSVTSPGTLAEELGTSTQTISYYINGKRKSSYENIVALTITKSSLRNLRKLRFLSCYFFDLLILCLSRMN